MRRYRIRHDKYLEKWGFRPYEAQYTDAIWPFGGWKPLASEKFLTLEAARHFVQTEKNFRAANLRDRKQMKPTYHKP